jgi:hypothetical protein
MSEAFVRSTFDPATYALASRLRTSAAEVTEPQRSRILAMMPNTLFISHTSRDDPFIKGRTSEREPPSKESIWRICGDYFYDPFYHSLQTGGADAYERIVGLALLSSVHVLIVWSEHAWRSQYVKAELLLATTINANVAAYIQAGTPMFPLDNIPMVYDYQELRSLLSAWLKTAGRVQRLEPGSGVQHRQQT